MAVCPIGKMAGGASGGDFKFRNGSGARRFDIFIWGFLRNFVEWMDRFLDGEQR